MPQTLARGQNESRPPFLQSEKEGGHNGFMGLLFTQPFLDHADDALG